MDDRAESPDDTPDLPANLKTCTFMLRRREKAHYIDRTETRVKCLDADELMRDFYGLHPDREWSPILVTVTEGVPGPVFIGRLLRDKVNELLEARAMDHKIPDELDPKSLCEPQ